MADNPVRVVHLMRRTGPTSMPWNDLYMTARHLAPGMMFLPAVMVWKPVTGRLIWGDCQAERRRYFSGDPLRNLVYIVKLYRRTLKRHKILVVHIHNPILSYLGAILKIICPKLKIVGNLHTDWSFLKLRHKIGINLLARISDHFIAVSNASLQSIPARIQRRFAKNRCISVILNGINVAQMERYLCHRRHRDSAGLPVQQVSAITAIVIARMVPAKNCFFILSLLAESQSIDRLIWFGDGELRERIETEIMRLGIGSRVELRGYCPRSEIFQELINATIYISASRWEGIGVANLEAAALGCMPFMSKIPAHNEIAESIGLNTYPLGNTSAWLHAIDDFLALGTSDRYTIQMKLAESTQRIYGINRTVNQYLDIYRRLGKSTYAL